MLEERARLLLEGIDPRKMRTQTSGAGVNFHQVYDDRERIYNGVYTKRKWVKNLEREREGEWRGPPLEKWHRGRCIQTVKDVYAVRVERSPIGGNATTVSSSSSSTRREEGGGALVSCCCCCGADGSAGFWFFSGFWPWNRRERGNIKAGSVDRKGQAPGTEMTPCRGLSLFLKSNSRRLKGKSRKNAPSPPPFSLSLSSLCLFSSSSSYHYSHVKAVSYIIALIAEENGQKGN